MKRNHAVPAFLACLSLLPVQELSPADQQKIESAIPRKAPARAKKPRRLLVVTLHKSNGKVLSGHLSIPAGSLALELMGKRTGAYEAVFSNDTSMFSPGKLKQFDAICFNNTGGVLTGDPVERKSLLDFVRNGKGFVGLHSAAATFCEYPKYDQFPEYGAMLGGYEDGGPARGENDTCTVKVDDPRNPINAVFAGKGFTLRDEVYQFGHGYSREKLHILLSIDMSKTDLDPQRRLLPERAIDKDFPISWVRMYGRGRVFYSGLGHNSDTFWNPALLEHFLAGIQFALGDLTAL
jgi:type 1 glutamine amidotransferase